MEIHKLISLLLFLFGGVFYLLTDNINDKLLIVVEMVAVGIWFYNANVLIPFVWLSPFILIYNASIYILDLTGVRPSYRFDIILNCIYISIVFLFSYCALFINTAKQRIQMSFSFMTENRAKIIKNMVYIFGLLLICYIPWFFATGYLSKIELNKNGGLPGFGIIANLFEMAYALYVVYYSVVSQKFPFRILSVVALISLSISLFIGERDIIFSIMLISLLVYYRFFKISNRTMAIIGAIVIVMVPILGMTKQITNKSNISIQKEDVIIGIFQGEFLSSGRNIETLTKNENKWDHQYGEGLYSDIVRSVIPTALVQIKNTTGWFNERYNNKKKDGYGAGFSYIGEGYLQAGYLGVAIWILILSFVCHRLYLWSQKSIYGFTSYVIMIGRIIYSLRGDLSYIISPLLKQILLQYFFFLYVLRFLSPVKRVAEINYP